LGEFSVPWFFERKGGELFDDGSLAFEVFKNAIGAFFEGWLGAVFGCDK